MFDVCYKQHEMRSVQSNKFVFIDFSNFVFYSLNPIKFDIMKSTWPNVVIKKAIEKENDRTDKIYLNLT